MALSTWNYVGRTVRDSARILRRATLAASGTPVRVAPFRDDVLARLGVWLQGAAEQLAEVRKRLDERLAKDKIKFSALEWTGARRERS